MTLPHVRAGEVARAAEQNDLITAVNSHTTEIDTAAGTISEHTTRIGQHTTQIAEHGNRIGALEGVSAAPRCILRKDANQSIPSGSDTDVTWQTVESGSSSMKSGNAIVVPTTGDYLLSLALNIQGGGNANTVTVAYLARNTSGFIGDIAFSGLGQATETSPNGLGNGMTISVVRRLNAGDGVKAMIWHGSGASRAARSSNFGGCTLAVVAQW